MGGYPVKAERIDDAAQNHAEAADQRMQAAGANGGKGRAGAIAVQHHADAEDRRTDDQTQHIGVFDVIFRLSVIDKKQHAQTADNDGGEHDFDDREKFLDTFRKYGFDIDRVRVERAGKIKDIRSTAISKMVIIRNYLNTKQFSRARLFDDSMENLKMFLHLQKEFEDIKYHLTEFYKKS